MNNSSYYILDNTKSSLIDKIIYDNNNAILTLAFKDNNKRNVYSYEKCPRAIFDHLEFLNKKNESLGKFFNKEIRPHYKGKFLYSYNIVGDIKPLLVE